ncbi:Transposase [hydrothermal vent metagenome]|uniref:Transposase n=1 Tax=hydrothermal vent metagenome TaxID=652676 RepID=A0A3B0SYM3_9ZZZZ
MAKEYQEEMFTNFQLSDRISKENFYRRLSKALDLSFLRKRTKGFYGKSGQKSIDPIVFFKLCLVGYLENIISDRKLMSHCSMRLGILYFIGYDIDEELPWHVQGRSGRVQVHRRTRLLCMSTGKVIPFKKEFLDYRAQRIPLFFDYL